MQIICTSLQTDNNASISSFNFFTGWMLFLTSSQHSQGTESRNGFLQHKSSDVFCYLFFLTVSQEKRRKHIAGLEWSILLVTLETPTSFKQTSLTNEGCLEGKREKYQVCSVQYCVQQLCTVQCTHTHKQT